MEPRVSRWIISILVARSQRSGEACLQSLHQRHEVSEARVSSIDGVCDQLWTGM